MATPSQIRANRLNAQRSTGPRTEAGKQSTKLNALKHGLAARELVLPNEDPANLDALRAELRADYAPATQIESMLVEEIAQGWWRLQRARRYEVFSIQAGLDRSRPFTPKLIEGLQRYMSASERAWHRAINQLRTVQNERRKFSEPAHRSDVADSTAPEAIGSVPQNESELAPREAAPQAPPIKTASPERPFSGKPPSSDKIAAHPAKIANPFAPTAVDSLEDLLESELATLDRLDNTHQNVRRTAGGR